MTGAMKMKDRKHNRGESVIAVVVSVLMTMACFSFADAADVGSAGQLVSPWAVKAGGETVAYVKNAQAGRDVVTGLRLYYYDNVQMQQEADVEPLVTVEKVTDPQTESAEIMSVEDAVKAVAAKNSTKSEPVIKVAYSKTLKETKEIKSEKKVIKTADLEKGEKRVEVKGKSGTKYVESEITQINSKVVDKDVMKSKVLEKPQTEVVYEGTALSSENKGKALIAFAKKYLGNKYVWGGESLEHGIDCSGYTMKCYEHYGITLPHSSSQQASCGKEVSHDDMQAGDLIIYPGHVAMYMGNGQIIHAAGEAYGIMISDEASYAGKIKHIRRIFGTSDDTSSDSIFPDTADIIKAYESDKGFGDGSGLASGQSAADEETSGASTGE